MHALNHPVALRVVSRGEHVLDAQAGTGTRLHSTDDRHGRRNFKDTNPLMSSLLVIFVWGGEAIL